MRLTYIGRTDEGVALLNEALPLLRRLGDVQGEVWLHQCLAAAPMLRGDLDAVRRHFAAARACAAAAGGFGLAQEVFQGEVWWAAITAPREVAEERYAAYLVWIARQGGAPIAEAGIGCEFRFRFGTPQEAIAQAHFARAEALRMAQTLESPRFVVHTALTAAEVAAARGDRAQARALLDLAWHHPGLAYDLRGQAEALAVCSEAPWPPPAAARTEDSAVVHAVAGSLADARPSPPGVPAAVAATPRHGL